MHMLQESGSPLPSAPPPLLPLLFSDALVRVLIFTAGGDEGYVVGGANRGNDNTIGRIRCAIEEVGWGGGGVAMFLFAGVRGQPF